MADEGVPVVAVESGVIVRASATDRGLGGVTLWLQGDSGVAYYYAHNVPEPGGRGSAGRPGRDDRPGRPHRQRPRPPPRTSTSRSTCAARRPSAEPCTVDPHPYLQTWAQAQVGGGVDGVGLVRARHRRVRSPQRVGLAAVGVPVRHPGRRPGAGGRRLGRRRPRLGRPLLAHRRDVLAARRRGRGPAAAGVRRRPGRTDVWPIAGDFDGDGRDTVGLYRQAEAAFAVLVDLGRRVGAGRRSARPAAPTPCPSSATGTATAATASASTSRATGPSPASTTRASPCRRRWSPPRGAGGLPGGGRLGRRRPRGRRRSCAATPSAFDLPVPNLLDPAAVRSVPVEGGPAVLPMAGDWNGDDLVTQDELRHIFGAGGRRPQGGRGPARPQRRHAARRHQHPRPEGRLPGDAAQRERVPLRRGRGRQRQPLPRSRVHPDHRRGQLPVAPATSSGSTSSGNPDLAINGLASPAIAAWYWTVARNINVSADALDMAAVNIAIGFAPSTRRDMVRCADFLTALRYYSGGEVPAGVNCERTPASRPLAFSAILPNPFGSGRPPPRRARCRCRRRRSPPAGPPPRCRRWRPSDPTTGRHRRRPARRGPAGPGTTATTATACRRPRRRPSTNPTPSQPPSSEPPTTADADDGRPSTSSPPSSETTTTETPTTTESTTTTVAVDPDSTTTSSLDSSTSN